MKPYYSVSSDYAILGFKKGSFYYGYEHSVCTNCGKTNEKGTESCDDCEDAERYWCFTAEIEGIDNIVIPFNKLGTNDMFNVAECLAVGIGWVLTKYNLQDISKKIQGK